MHTNGFQDWYLDEAGYWTNEPKNQTCDPAACEIITNPYAYGLSDLATVSALPFEQHGVALTRRYIRH